MRAIDDERRLADESKWPPVDAHISNDRLPHSELHMIDATHFIWEDAADEYATLVTRWWAGGFKTDKSSRGIVAGEAQSFTQ